MYVCMYVCMYVYEKYSGKTAKDITKHFRTRLRKKWTVKDDDDEIKNLETKVKDENYVYDRRGRENCNAS